MKSSSPRFLPVFCMILFLLCLQTPTAFGQQSADELSDPEQIYAYANGLMKRGFYDLALPQLENFRQNYSDNPHAQDVDMLYIYCLRELKKDHQALSEIQAYFTKWKDKKNMLQLRIVEAECHYQMGNFPAAENSYRSIIPLTTGDTADMAVYFLAQSLLKQGKMPEALEQLQILAAKDFDTAKNYRIYAAYAVAQQFVKQNKLPEAIDIITRMLNAKKMPEAMKYELTMQLGNLYFNSRDFSKAAYWYDLFCTTFSESPAVKQASKQVIICKFYLDDYSATFNLCNEWRKKNPDAQEPELDYYQALAAVKIQNYEAALPIWQSLTNHPSITGQQHDDAVLHTLDCLRRLGKNQDYLQLAERFLNDNPNSSSKNSLLFEMGKIHYLANDFTSAAAKFKTAHEGFVGEPENFYTSGELLAHCYGALHQWKEAADTCSRMAAFAQCPTPGKFHFQAATFLLQIKAENNEDALKELIAASQCEKEPEECLRALQQLVLLNIKAKNYDLTLDYLEPLIAASRVPECLQWQFVKAQIYYEKKLYSESENTVNQLLANQELPSSVKNHSIDFLLTLIMAQNQIDKGDMAIFLVIAALEGIPNNKVCFAPSQASSDSTEIIRFTNLLAFGDFLGRNNNRHAAQKVWELILEKTDVTNVEIRSIAAPALASILIFDGNSKRANTILANFKDEMEKQQKPLSRHALALMGEGYLAEGNYKAAFIYASQALSQSLQDTLTLEDQTRANYVKAVVLLENNKDYSQAFACATKCFVFSEDSYYSPRAMIIAIRCLENSGDKEKAKKIKSELKETYPAAAAELLN